LYSVYKSNGHMLNTLFSSGIHIKDGIEEVKKILKRASELIALKESLYKERRLKLNLPTVKYRRLR